MIGQVALYQVANPEQAQEKIVSKKAELLELANQAYPSIVKRGGGARDLHVEQIKGETDFLVVYLHVDTQEAMGANMLNTMLEALKPVLEELSQGPESHGDSIKLRDRFSGDSKLSHRFSIFESPKGSRTRNCGENGFS